MKKAIFTIASNNYFFKAKVLLESLKETNGDFELYLVVADLPDISIVSDCNKNGVKILTIDNLTIDNINDFKFRYDILEINTAIKPFAFDLLLKKYDCVLYFDPDICVYRKLDLVNDAFDKGYNFVLTPHLGSYILTNKLDNELDIFKAGIFNLGFIGIKKSIDSQLFLQYWKRMLKNYCFDDQKNGIFVDQKFVDVLPALFSNYLVIKDCGYNVAYWNLLTYKISKDKTNILFNGNNLVFFHFSGFNHNNPAFISKHNLNLKVHDFPILNEIFNSYKDKLINNQKYSISLTYKYDYFSTGEKICKFLRILYRSNKKIHRLFGDNPFNNYKRLVQQKNIVLPELASVIFNYAIYNHQIQIPKSQNYDNYSLSFRDILLEYIKTTNMLNAEWKKYLCYYLILNNKKIPSKNGFNVLGYVSSEIGMGESIRRTADCLISNDIHFSLYDFENGNTSPKNDKSYLKYCDNKFLYNKTIFNINADQMISQFNNLPSNSLNTYRIGFWSWELSDFPNEWLESFNLVDEIWAPSKFIYDCLKRYTKKPVIWMPQGIEFPSKNYERFKRQHFGLATDKFIFLSMFDIRSYASRKNPFAAIKAFKKAFIKNDKNVCLVLKINNYDAISPDVKKAIYSAIKGYENIILFSKHLTRTETIALINNCDCSISLHRSEGVGLLCQESMKLGKPVIATNYSGNLDFMNKDCSCLVSYKLINVDDYAGINVKGKKWADPSITEAAKYMSRLYNDKKFYKEISTKAKKYIDENFNPKICGSRMKKRLEEINNEFCVPLFLEKPAYKIAHNKTFISTLINTKIGKALKKNKFIRRVYYRYFK